MVKVNVEKQDFVFVNEKELRKWMGDREFMWLADKNNTFVRHHKDLKDGEVYHAYRWTDHAHHLQTASTWDFYYERLFYGPQTARAVLGFAGCLFGIGVGLVGYGMFRRRVPAKGVIDSIEKIPYVTHNQN